MKKVKYIFFTTLFLAAIERILSYTGITDMFSHFVWLYIIYFLGFAIFWKTKGRRRRPIYSLIAALVYAASFFPFILGYQPQKTGNYTDISIMQYNIFFHNYRIEQFTDYLNLMSDDRPDIILLNESDNRVCNDIRNLGISNYYPIFYCGRDVVAPGAEVFGNAFFSSGKFQWVKAPTYFIGHGELPVCKDGVNPVEFKCIDQRSVKNTIEKNFIRIAEGKWLRIFNLHTTSPVRDLTCESRDKELQKLSQLATEPDPTAVATIALGDWNITPYSPIFPKINGMYNAANYKSFLGTWPDFLPSILRLPLDNMLVTKNVEILERKVLPSLNSDHAPVLYKIRVYW